MIDPSTLVDVMVLTANDLGRLDQRLRDLRAASARLRARVDTVIHVRALAERDDLAKLLPPGGGLVSRTFLTADLHFGHRNISRYAGRPYEDSDDGVTEMNEDLIDRWNFMVAPEDKVIVLGDVCMGRIEDSLRLIGRLHGTKILVAGNHDRCWPVSDPLRGEWRDRYLEAGFADVIGRGFVVIPGAGLVVASHFPPAGDSGEVDRYDQHRPTVPDDAWVLHGHVHEKWLMRGRCINVGVDAWGGFPVSLDVIALYVKFHPGGADLPPERWLR